jgi:hypothetical protein
MATLLNITPYVQLEADGNPIPITRASLLIDSQQHNLFVVPQGDVAANLQIFRLTFLGMGSSQTHLSVEMSKFPCSCQTNDPELVPHLHLKHYENWKIEKIARLIEEKQSHR